MSYRDAPTSDVCTDFEAAARYLANARDGFQRPIGNNTRVHWRERGEEQIGIELHYTDVIVLHANGDTEFHTGGWQTVTTKSRINWNRNFATYSERLAGESHWVTTDCRGASWWEKDPNERYLMNDSITFNSKGECISGNESVAALEREHKATVKETRRNVGKLNFYCRLATDKLREGMAADPTDCLACHHGQASHIAEHVLEREVPAALIFNAVHEHCDTDIRELLGMWWDDCNLMMGGKPLGQCERLIRSALYRYIDKRVIGFGSTTQVPFDRI